MNENPPIAHVRAGADGRPVLHELLTHLQAVADRGSAHAKLFSAGDWAYLAGLWHDLGKYRPGFQRYIRETNDPAPFSKPRFSVSDWPLAPQSGEASAQKGIQRCLDASDGKTLHQRSFERCPQ